MASCASLAERYRPGWVAGFDLRPWGRFLPISIPLTAEEWQAASPTLLSEIVMPFEIDFGRTATIEKERKHLLIRAIHPGQVDGIIAWVWLELTPDIQLDGQAGPGAGVWKRYWHPFTKPFRIQADETLAIEVEHTEQGLNWWVTDPRA